MQALVIDPVATDPPQPHHLAAHADVVASSPDDLAHALDTLPIGLVVVDEAETWLSQGDANRRPIGPLVDILRRGRHRGVSIYLCSQRPQLLAYDVWSLADRIVICQLTGKRDLDRVCELEGVAEHRHAIASSNRPGPVVTWTPAGIVRHP